MSDHPALPAAPPPDDPRALLLAIEPDRQITRLGALGARPPDAPMIAKAIKEEHPRPRPVHLTVEHFFKGDPGLAMLLNKIGGVPAHPANVHRLLCDEQQLVLVSTEGRKGTV